ncbi:MAG: pyrroline-5-carboxylate reductase [Thermoguttaceae bacterium]
MLSERIGFIGAGQMATALGLGLVKAGLAAPERLIASDPSAEALRRFTVATGGRTTQDNREVVSASDVMILAVKPQQMAAVFADLHGMVTAEKLVVSIAAGVRIARLADGLGSAARLVRVMPNTPCLVGLGACGYCLGETATAGDGELVKRMLQAVGIACQVEEKLLDAVTGLSGSGPAFVYVMIEALSDGGVRMGLPRQIATVLAAQTVRGAAEMVLSSGEHPGVLKDRVTSPGGTTIAGLAAMEAGAVRADLMAAVEAATRRSAELGGSS